MARAGPTTGQPCAAADILPEQPSLLHQDQQPSICWTLARAKQSRAVADFLKRASSHFAVSVSSTGICLKDVTVNGETQGGRTPSQREKHV